MKRILQFCSVIITAIPQLLFYCILVFVFIVVNSTTSYAQQSKDSFALGTTSSFVKNFHDKAAFDNKTLRVKKPSVSLAISANKKFKLNIVMHNQFSQDEEEFVGNIDTLEGGSFFIRRINNKLEGHILFARKNKAYSLSSDNKGNAFVKEIDINKVICTNYGSNKKALDNKPIGIPSLPVGGTPTILSGPAYSTAIMSLESLHGANGCALLDFDGQDVYGTPWNSTIDTIHALPSGLSESQILDVWKLVSEDYRPFNINITTSEAVFDSYPKTMRMRCIFTPTDVADSGEGGVAYLQSFSWNDDTPCWSFESGSAKDAAEPASHEIGHTFGLLHQGRTLPVTGHEEYFSGQGNWGPIMGDAGYYVPLAQWSKGEYMYADNTEDELALIAAPAYGVGYRADDYGNTTATAAPLIITNGYVNDSGFIGQTTDVDVFSYSIPAGKIHLDIKGIPNYTDLDVLAKLYNSTGTLIRTYDDTTSFNIAIDTTLNAGNYYLSVEGTGTGNPLVTGYTKYASLGSYYITGYVPTLTPIAPSIINSIDSGYLGTSFNYTIPIINNENYPATYTATNLPAGLSLNSVTGQISGTPTTAGIYVVNVTANNGYGTGAGTDTLKIFYLAPYVHNDGIAIRLASPFTYQINATNFPTKYGVIGLPSWATLDTLTGIISGTPINGVGTFFTMTLIGSNPGGSATANFFIYINPPVPGIPTVVPSTQMATAGVAFSDSVFATNSPTNYAAINLPPGLNIDPLTGVITGVPTTTGTYNATITATNAYGDGTGITTITVGGTSLHIAPVVTSTSMSGTNGTAFSYAILATNSPTNYSVSALPAGLTLNNTTGVISGTPTLEGTYIVNVSATNIYGTGTGTDTITILYAPPFLDYDGIIVTLASPFNYPIIATNHPTSYHAVNLPAWATLDTLTGIISGTPNVLTFSIIDVTLTVINPAGSSTNDLYIQINPGPIYTVPTVAPYTETATVGVPFTFTAYGTNFPASYAAANLPPGLSIDPPTGIVSGTPTTAGNYSVTITATNSYGSGSAITTINIIGVSSAPVVTSATITGIVGNLFTYTISATNGATSYGSTTLPGGLVLNKTTGVISGTPTVSGTFTITDTAKNSGGSGTGTLTITINLAKPVVATASTTGTVGVPFSYTISATNSPTSYGSTTLPAGLGLNATTGIITGTPTTAGTFTTTDTAKNISGSGTGTLTITINPAKPVVTSTSVNGTIGVLFSYTIAATNSPTSYGTSALPGGLIFNNVTGTISGTPTTAGTFTISDTARNITGFGVGTLTIIITATVPPAPVVTSGSIAGTVGSSFSYTIMATNGPTGYSSTILPAGLSLNSSGVINGIPTVAGTFTITDTAKNAGGSGAGTLTITINPAKPVVAIASTIGTVGIAFSYVISATNAPIGYGSTLLPVGLSLNTTTGVISGTPTAAGTFTITDTAKNVSGAGTGTLTITINPAKPVLAAASAIGTVGTVFSYAISATNAPTGYSSPTLPAGLSLNTTTGVISGTPTITGTFTITDTAKNVSGSGTGTLTITINPAKPVVAAASVIGAVGTAFSYVISATNAPTDYSSTTLPAGLSLNTATGVISGTPTIAGTFTITDTAKNVSGSGTGTLTITINPAKPVVAIASTIGTVGTAFSYTISATNAPTGYGSTLLPAGLSLNTTTGVINGTPTVAGTFTITDTAKNAGGSGTGTLTITINSAKPVITSTSVNATTAILFSYTIAATNAPTSYRVSALPAGLSFNSSTGTISGIPTTTGTFAIADTATNVSGSGTGTLTINITATLPSAPVITSGAISGTIGTAFSYTISATNSPTGYSSSALPAGLTLNSAGVISGTPIVTGVFIINDTAKNAGGSGAGTVTITINSNVTAPPIITSNGTVNGTIGTPFEYSITVNNSATSYNATGLPVGLTINTTTGTITGVPTVGGVFAVRITAVNGGGAANNIVTITIVTPVAPVIYSDTVAIFNMNDFFSYNIEAYNIPTSYGAVGLPQGLTVDTTTGLISGKTVVAGVYTVTLKANNAVGTGTKNLVITVNGNEVSSTSSIVLPDPVTKGGSFAVTLPGWQLDETAAVEIINFIGEVVQKADNVPLQNSPIFNVPEVSLNVPTLPAGYYIIIVKGTNTKIIKEFSIE